MHARAAFSIMTQKAPPTRLLHLNASIHAALPPLHFNGERGVPLFRSLARCYRALLSHFPQFVVAPPSHAQKLAFARTMMHAARQTVQLRNCSHLGRARANYIQGRDSDRKHRCNFLFERFALCNPKESIVGQSDMGALLASSLHNPPWF